MDGQQLRIAGTKKFQDRRNKKIPGCTQEIGLTPQSVVTY